MTKLCLIWPCKSYWLVYAWEVLHRPIKRDSTAFYRRFVKSFSRSKITNNLGKIASNLSVYLRITFKQWLRSNTIIRKSITSQHLRQTTIKERAVKALRLRVVRMKTRHKTISQRNHLLRKQIMHHLPEAHPSQPSLQMLPIEAPKLSTVTSSCRAWRKK